ncbi:hypothetical protein ACFQS1_12165 [Paractinoplanes rhizophilus]|uniref:Uncharacterized protein n=1 Tax=Paractinoplanes rhizophilus TaxID=1416877 RepID=A0ABW2HQB2_9ACTN
MSLSSLRSFSGAASLATTAFDTARSTLKAMAEAAVPPPGSDAASAETASAETSTGERRHQGATATPTAAAVTKSEAADVTPTERRKAGIRKGLALDAYA